MLDYYDYLDYDEEAKNVIDKTELAWTYVPPFILLIGLVGNSLVFVVLTKSSMKQTTTSLYLRFLAVFDTLVLYIVLLRHWIIYLADYDIRNYHPVVCKIHTWVTLSISYIATWLLVAVTLERSLSVWFPHKVKVICTKRNTYIIISSIIVCMFLLNAHYIYGLGDRIYSGEYGMKLFHCVSTTDAYFNFETYIWPWVTFSVWGLIPSFILIVCNICIIYKVVSSSRLVLRNDSSTIQRRHLSSRQSQATSLTAMLVVTSVTSVISVTPYTIYILYYGVFKYMLTSYNELAVSELVYTVSSLLSYINNAINFILYCICGQQFRKELRTLLFGVTRHRSQIFTTSLSTRRSQKTPTSTSTSKCISENQS